MNLIFRMLIMILGCIGKKRLDILATGVRTMRCWPNDLDFNIHMNNGRYLTIMDIGRIEMMIRTGALREALKRKWRPMMAGITIRFRRGIAPFQKFRLVTQTVCWDERWFYSEQRFETPDGQILAIAYTRACYSSEAGGIPMADVLATIGHTEPSPPMPEYIRAWIDAEDASRNHLKQLDANRTA